MLVWHTNWHTVLSELAQVGGPGQITTNNNFQSGASFVDYLCYFLSCFVMLSCKSVC